MVEREEPAAVKNDFQPAGLTLLTKPAAVVTAESQQARRAGRKKAEAESPLCLSDGLSEPESAS